MNAIAAILDFKRGGKLGEYKVRLRGWVLDWQIQHNGQVRLTEILALSPIQSQLYNLIMKTIPILKLLKKVALIIPYYSEILY